MRILFGINNDDTAKGIADFYEKKYQEKLEYKNVYYFKQFVQELSKGEYDRAVVLEDLEKFPTNNYAQIDEYLFKNIDAITDVYDAKTFYSFWTQYEANIKLQSVQKTMFTCGFLNEFI